MKIAICDDDFLYLEKIAFLLKEYVCQFNLSVQDNYFNCAEDLLLSDCKSYSVIFLDVNIKTMNGIDVARKIRQMNSEVIIVYISELLEFATKGYEVQAFRYLLKCDLDKSFPNCMNAVIEKLNKGALTYSIKTNHEEHLVPLENIIYIESKKRQAIFHVDNENREQFSFYEKLTAIEGKLKEHGFLRIHKSFIVNMNYIAYIKNCKAFLSNGASLNISESKYKEIIGVYALWKGKL